MDGWRKSRILKVAALLAAVVGLYAWLGFRVAPGLLRQYAIDHVRDTYRRELRIGEVRLQPFKLQLEVRDLAFPDRDGPTMLGLRRLFVDFELASLWRGAWVFRELSIDEPEVRLVLRRDGRLNLADLAPPPTADPGAGPPAPATSLPRLWIQQLAIRGGRAEYVQFAGRRNAFTREFTPVGFTLRDFRTTPEGGAFSLAAQTAAGERFDWSGRFALAPSLASEGEFRVGGLLAAGIGEFLGDALPFHVTAGSIDLGGRYRLSLGAATQLEMTIPTLSLKAAALRARGADEDWVRLPSLTVQDAVLRLPARAVSVAGLRLEGLNARMWVDRDGSVNLQRLFVPAASPAPLETDASGVPGGPVAPAAAVAPPAPGATRPASPVVPAAGAAGAAPWDLRVARIELADAAFDVEDRRTRPTRAFRFAPLQARVEGVSLDLSRSVPVSLETTIDDHATFRLAGEVTPAPLAARVDVALERARMQVLQPFVLPFADLTLRSGLLAVSGQLLVQPPGTAGPRVAFGGELSIRDFGSIDNTLREDLVGFRLLEVRGLRYSLQPDALAIDRVRLASPRARVVISPEQVLNLSAVLDPRGTAQQLEARRALRAARAAETRAQKRARERAAKQLARERARAARKAARAGAGGAVPVQAIAVERGLPIRIRELRIEDGRMSFADLNVRPNFAADILGLQGTVTGLSTAPGDRAVVDLKGRVDEFSPVTIAGTLQPFAFDRYTDLSMRFENISLPVLNPYSGQLAGYNIAKGKLTTELHYQIDQRRLNAAHRIRLDQLEWGEASANKGVATLPVRFATSLLKDRDGVIQLDVPVTGTLDDPKLRIGPIVWQIIKNLLLKAVTAPFALLGALFAGAEDAQFVEFAPGTATLDEAVRGRLGALAKALAQKPAVSIDVPIGASAALDRPALAELRYLGLRDAALAGVLRRKDGDPAPLPAFEALEPRQRLATLRALLATQGGELPAIPEPPPAPEGASRGEARALAVAAEIAFLERTARARASVGDGELQALARERASTIQRALLEGGVLEPARVFLVNEGKVGDRDGRVRFELGLK